jgi:uncharacterized protein (TIGR02284 family)
MHNPEQILNDLIATCRDSEEGFGKAAKGAHSDQLRELLTEIEGARSDFADQLAKLMGQSGFKPQMTGHTGEILHRGWIDLETRIRPEQDRDLIDECRTGEMDTLKHYESALARPEFPEQARGLVEGQLRQIRDDIANKLVNAAHGRA